MDYILNLNSALYKIDTKVMERIRFLCSMGQTSKFNLLSYLREIAKGTPGYYKVVFIALSKVITKFSLNL